MKALNERAKLLLMLVASRCYEGRFFVPSAYDMSFHWPSGQEHAANGREEVITTSVSGSGDAALLRGLQSRGLLRQYMPSETEGPKRYWFILTEDGLKAVDELKTSGWRPRKDGRGA